MEPDVLEWVQKNVIDVQVNDVAEAFLSQNGELHHRIVLGVLATGLRYLVEEELEDVDENNEGNDGDVGFAQRFKPDKKDEEDADDEEEWQDEIDLGTEDTPQDAPILSTSRPASERGSAHSLPGSARNFALYHENNEYLQRNQTVDLVLCVYDKRIFATRDVDTAYCAAGIFNGKGLNLAKLEVSCSQRLPLRFSICSVGVIL
jgi:hypothetical protein